MNFINPHKQLGLPFVARRSTFLPGLASDLVLSSLMSAGERETLSAFGNAAKSIFIGANGIDAYNVSIGRFGFYE